MGKRLAERVIKISERVETRLVKLVRKRVTLHFSKLASTRKHPLPFYPLPVFIKNKHTIPENDAFS